MLFASRSNAKSKKLNINLNPQSICTTRELINLHLIMGVTWMNSSFHVSILPYGFHTSGMMEKDSPLSDSASEVKYHPSVTISLIPSLWAFKIFTEWKDLAKRDPSILFLFYFTSFHFNRYILHRSYLFRVMFLFIICTTLLWCRAIHAANVGHLVLNIAAQRRIYQSIHRRWCSG